MKRVLVIGVAVLFGLQAGFALAAATGNPDTGPGCGLGKLAWQNYPHQKTIGVQVLEATTNGTFGSGTFGISSGTSGCTNDGQVWASEKANVFAAINFDNETHATFTLPTTPFQATFNHTTSGTDRALVVMIAQATGSRAISSVTYGTDTMIAGPVRLRGR